MFAQGISVGHTKATGSACPSALKLHGLNGVVHLVFANIWLKKLQEAASLDLQIPPEVPCSLLVEDGGAPDSIGGAPDSIGGAPDSIGKATTTITQTAHFKAETSG